MMSNRVKFKRPKRQFLFDDRAIALTLYALRCPRCRNGYTHCYQTLKVPQNRHRPFLLPCGHNMCENCIEQYSANLVCVECNHPVLKPSSSVPGQSHFDVNYFLVGKITRMRYFYRYASNNNNVEFSSGLSEISDDTPKCSECGMSDSVVGNCKTCKSIFCHACFIKVHKNSRVLQKHKFESHFDPISQLKIKKLKVCTIHGVQKRKFCQECHAVICLGCHGADHQGHEIMSLQAKNASCKPQVKELVKLTDQIWNNMRAAKKTVSAAENQLKQHASDAIENVSNYFLKLHSILQNEEKQILEYFENAAAPTHKKMQEAVEGLKENEQQLNDVRATLSHMLTNTSDNANFETVIDFCNKKLETLQCQSSVTEMKNNPFCFKPIQDPFHGISKKLCHWKFIDPEFSIDFGNYLFAYPQKYAANVMEDDYATASEFSLSENLSIEEGTLDVVSSDDREIVPLAATSSKNVFAGSFAPQKKAKPIVMKCIQKTGLVSHIENPSCFYVQLDENKNDVLKISLDYIDLRTKWIPASDVRIDKIYMIYHRLDSESLWYRSKVIEQINDIFYKVFMIDVGKSQSIKKEELFEYDPEKHLALAPVAKRCSINNLVPFGKEWSEKAKTHFITMIDNQNVKLEIYKQTAEEMSVDILIYKNEDILSVRNFFLYSGFGRAIEKSHNSEFKALTAKAQLRLNSHQLNLYEMVSIRILHVKHPQDFSVIKLSDLSVKRNLKEDLNLDYKENEKFNERIYVGALQLACAVFIDDTWQRAVIEEIEQAGQVLVRLVDEGTSTRLKWSDLYVLKKRFREQSELAIRCMLADVEPLQENNYSWPDAAIEHFNRLRNHPDIYIAVSGKHLDYYRVCLNLVRKHCDCSVSAILVAKGYCKSTGESSRHVELPKNAESEQLVSESGKQQFKRSGAVVTHIANPAHFYVQVGELQGGIDRFHQQLQLEGQALSAKRYGSAATKLQWNKNDHCLILVTYKDSLSTRLHNGKYHAIVSPAIDEESEWYRGIILDIDNAEDSQLPYIVFLRDIGAVYRLVSAWQLFKINHDLDRVANGAYLCHLGGIGPTATEDVWSFTSIDFFKHMIDIFDKFAVTLLGVRDKNGSLPVLLWGAVNETVHAVGPDMLKYSNINKLLVDRGLARLIKETDIYISMECFDFTASVVDKEKNEITMNEWVIEFVHGMHLNSVDDTADCVIEDYTRESSILSDILIETNGQEDMVNIEDLDSFMPVLEAPDAWLKQQEINKTIFTGITTYVDMNCILYLHDAEQNKLLSYLTKKINETYGNKTFLAELCKNYVTGQPCIVRYHSDKKYYRGIVKSKTEDGMYSVYFIDYGNEEITSIDDLLPVVPFPQLNAFAGKYKLHGICPKNNAVAFSVSTLDNLHNLVVGNLAIVRVILETDDESDDIKSCEISVGVDNAARVLVKNGHADVVNNAVSSADTIKSIKTLAKTEIKKRHIKPKNPISTENNFSDDELNDECFVGFDASKMYKSAKRLSIGQEENMHIDFFEDLNNISPDVTPAKKCVQQPEPEKHSGTEEKKRLISESIIMNIGNDEYSKSDDLQILRREKRIIDSFYNRGNEPFVNYNDDADNKLDNTAAAAAAKKPNKSSGISRQQFEMQAMTFGDDFDVNSYTIKSMKLQYGLSSFREHIVSDEKFNCEAIAVLSPTVLQIFPKLEWFYKHDTVLKTNIKRLMPRAPPLLSYEKNVVCLARYHDGEWCRAIIKNYQPENRQVKVLFIDSLEYYDLALKDVRSCPEELQESCLCNITIRLFGVKPNPHIPTEEVREALMDCVRGKNLIAKRVHVYDENADEDVFEPVILYYADTKELAYKKLLENGFFLRI